MNREKVKKNLKWIILFILVVIFIFLTIAINTGIIQGLDDSIYNFISETRNDFLTNSLKVITNLGGVTSMFFITLVTIIILFLMNKRKYGIAISLNLIISSLSYVILKNIFQRPRPNIEERLIEESGYSFPSGHSTNNMAFYLLIIYLIYINIQNKKLRNVLCIIFSIIPIIIGFSRIYLRVHYPSDVLAGFCLGGIIVILFTSFIYKKIKD